MSTQKWDPIINKIEKEIKQSTIKKTNTKVKPLVASEIVSSFEDKTNLGISEKEKVSEIPTSPKNKIKRDVIWL